MNKSPKDIEVNLDPGLNFMGCVKRSYSLLEWIDSSNLIVCSISSFSIIRITSSIPDPH